jgi:hypothetical protein
VSVCDRTKRATLIHENSAMRMIRFQRLLPSTATKTIKMGRNGMEISTSTTLMSTSSTQRPRYPLTIPTTVPTTTAMTATTKPISSDVRVP